jgi:hypothetical protein
MLYAKYTAGRAGNPAEILAPAAVEIQWFESVTVEDQTRLTPISASRFDPKRRIFHERFV